MTTNYYIVDVFTDTPFSGAQLAVFPEAAALDEQQMQVLAGELNLAESVFITSCAADSCHLRIFSPSGERHFSGQAIIGAAYVLATRDYVTLAGQHTTIAMTQNTGTSNVVISKSNNDDLFIQFSRKAHPVIDRYVPASKELAAALSVKEDAIGSTRYQTLLVACEQPYLIVPMRSFAAVREAVFNLKEWSNTVAPVAAASELLLFSTKSDRPHSNFHGRLVGPMIGPQNDPPIGSAMPAFAGYLSSHEHIRQGTYTFVIDRGTLATRKSVLSVDIVNQPGKESTIRVGGPAVIVAQGSVIY